MSKLTAIIIGFIGAAVFIPLGALFGTKIENPTNILFLWGVALAITEVAKQIFLTTQNGYYDINRIPFQLCSTCMYVALLMPLLCKTELTNSAALGYIGFVSFTAAFFYFVNPSAIIQTPFVAIKIHSYAWHWSMLFMGALTVTSSNLLDCWKPLVESLVAFTILIAVAVLCNVLYTKLSGYGTTITDPFKGINFYYLREGAQSTMPLFNMLFPFNKPYILAVPCFIIYFSIGTGAMYGIMQGIKALVKLFFMRG